MRVLFVAALSVALLSTPAAADIKAYCEQTREILKPVFEVGIYQTKFALAEAHRDDAYQTCEKKYKQDIDKQQACEDKADEKYPEPEKPKLKSLMHRELLKGLSRRKAQKALKKVAVLYGSYCKKF